MLTHEKQEWLLQALDAILVGKPEIPAELFDAIDSVRCTALELAGPYYPDCLLPEAPLSQAWHAIMAVADEEPDFSTGGCRTFYSPRDWAKKGEDEQPGAVLIVVHDGGDFAKFFNWDYEDATSVERMAKALKGAGFWSESISCWATAIYEGKSW